MKLLITGASGFIGTRLVRAACAIYGQKNVMALSSRPGEACDTIVYDGLDLRMKQAELNQLASVDALIHAGAFTPKRGPEANDLQGCNSNISFTEQLLNLPFRKLQTILYLSTLDVYAPADLITESTPTAPETLYGLSKLYCERMVTLFATKANISSQILRIGHVYGPGEEKYAKFLPATIQNIVAGNAVELWGDGAELRSFIYIDDVVSAILAAVGLRDKGGIINVVGGQPISIRRMLDAVIALSGKQVEIVVREFDGAKRNYVFDNTKLKTQLLSQETDFLTGLRAEYAHIEGLN